MCIITEVSVILTKIYQDKRIMADATGVCFTQSGNVKRYESTLGPSFDTNTISAVITRTNSGNTSYEYKVTASGYRASSSGTSVVVKYGPSSAVAKKTFYFSIIQPTIFQIRYSLPLFEYGEDLRISNVGTPFIWGCYIPVSRSVPFCTYNKIDYNSYISYVDSSTLEAENIPSELIAYNVGCTMFGPLKHIYKFGTLTGVEDTYNYVYGNKINGHYNMVGKSDVTMSSKRPIEGTTTVPINLLDISYFDNSSWYDDKGNHISNQELFYSRSLICDIKHDKNGLQGFCCYDMNKLSIGNYSYTAININISNNTTYDFLIKNKDITYNFRCVLDKEYCNTFAYDPINYFYKIYEGNLEDIFIIDKNKFNISDISDGKLTDCLNTMTFNIIDVKSGSDYKAIFYEDDYLITNESLVFTIDTTEIKMRYKLSNYKISIDGEDVDFASLFNFSSNINPNKLYEGKNTFTITVKKTGKYNKQLNIIASMQIKFYSGPGSKYIDLRKNASIDFNFFEYTQYEQ